ncbi:MAG: hypothetical protein R3B84_01125 [Zavarzinella sp.]
MNANRDVRYPLGLPPGSVRGLMSLQIMFSFWLLLLLPDTKSMPIPLNLYFLLGLVMVFFVSHGKSIDHSEEAGSPLGLPKGTIRVVIVLITGAIVAYLALQMPERFGRLTPTGLKPREWQYYMGALFGGFFFGHFLRIFPFKNAAVFQSFQAWLALLSMFALVVELIIDVFINPTMLNKIDTVAAHTALTAIVAGYFGTRS